MRVGVQTEDALAAGVERVVRGGAEALVRLQRADGSWSAEVTAGTRPLSDFVFLQFWFERSVREADRALLHKAGQAILAQRNPDGGFAAYPGGPGEIDTSVMAYAAAKLAGGDDSRLSAAREWIRSAGGLQSASADVKVVLALFGWCARPASPASPALEILRSADVRRPSPHGFTLKELGSADAPPAPTGSITQRIPWLRNRALRRAGEAFIERLERGDGLGTVDSYAYAIMALDALGSEAKDQVEREYGALIVDDGSRFAAQPFNPAVHNTRLAVEALSASGAGAEAAARGRAWLGTRIGETKPVDVETLIAAQEQDGSWYGREGVNYIYGTFRALRDFAAAGESDREAHVLRGGEWLRSIQNADGGWGESCASYDKGAFVAAPSTPSQTAWAVLGLIAGGDTGSQSVRRGVEYLAGAQQTDGSWREDAATATAVPRRMYLRYDLYRQAYPLLALSTYLKSRNDEEQ